MCAGPGSVDCPDCCCHGLSKVEDWYFPSRTCFSSPGIKIALLRAQWAAVTTVTSGSTVAVCSGDNNVFVILSSQMELVGTHDWDTQLLCLVHSAAIREKTRGVISIYKIVTFYIIIHQVNMPVNKLLRQCRQTKATSYVLRGKSFL